MRDVELLVLLQSKDKIYINTKYFFFKLKFKKYFVVYPEPTSEVTPRFAKNDMSDLFTHFSTTSKPKFTPTVAITYLFIIFVSIHTK